MTVYNWTLVCIVGLIWIEHYMRWKKALVKLKNSNQSEKE